MEITHDIQHACSLLLDQPRLSHRENLCYSQLRMTHPELRSRVVERLNSSPPRKTCLEVALATKMETTLRVGYTWRDLGAEVGSPRPKLQGQSQRRVGIREHREDLPVGDRFGSLSTSMDRRPRIIGRPQVSRDASVGPMTIPSIDVPLREAHP